MRFALYYSPPATSRLWEIGSKWLGRDAVTGKKVGQDPFPGISAGRIEEITRTPRRYGLHATLKPPFQMADGKDEQGLRLAVEQFVGDYAPFTIPPLQLNVIDTFFCLSPARQDVVLTGFACDCVMRFDEYRAAMSLDERNRRCKQRLSELEKKYLLKWGYPYVLDLFQFHITLTDKIESSSERELIGKGLQDIFAPVLGQLLTIDGLSLFIEPGPESSFHRVERFRLGQKALNRDPVKCFLCSLHRPYKYTAISDT